MKIPWFKEIYDDNIVIQEIKKHSILSVGEIFVIKNENLFQFDLFNGIYTNKIYNSISIYFIYSIEYEDYDKKLYPHSHFLKKEIKFNDKIEDFYINSFKLIDNNDIKIEFIPYDYDLFFQLPENLFKYIFSNLNSLVSLIYEKEYKLFIDEVNKGKNIFFIYGKKRNGITNLFRKFSDDNGYSFFKKVSNNFESKNTFLNYLKKREFMSPCLIYLKELKTELLDEYCLLEYENIFNMTRITKKNNIYIFYHENLFEIPNYIKDKYQIINFHNINLEEKHQLILNSFTLFQENYEIILNKSFAQKISENIKNSKIKNINKEYLKEEQITKMIINLPLKDLKSSLLNSYYSYFQNISLNFNNILSKEILRIYNNFINNSKNERISIASIPKITWSEIGGLTEIKNEIDKILNPKIMVKNIKKPNGILLYGPSGTGKTLIAKAIANTSSMNFINIKGPELLNMYFGESENNIKKIFEEGKNNSPCVLFFDEIDSLIQRKSNNLEQDNIMNRIVSQFIIEFDEINFNKDIEVIVIGTTNRINFIESSLLRPGRFDKVLYVDLPKSLEQKMNIFKIHSKNFSIENNNDNLIKELCEIMPINYSGADIYKVCALSFIKAFKNFIQNNKNPLTKQKEIIITKENIISSIKNTPPSTSIYKNI